MEQIYVLMESTDNVKPMQSCLKENFGRFKHAATATGTHGCQQTGTWLLAQTHCLNYFFIHFESYTLQCCVVKCLLMLHNFWCEMWSMLRRLKHSVKF